MEHWKIPTRVKPEGHCWGKNSQVENLKKTINGHARPHEIFVGLHPHGSVIELSAIRKKNMFFFRVVGRNFDCVRFPKHHLGGEDRPNCEMLIRKKRLEVGNGIFQKCFHVLEL